MSNCSIRFQDIEAAKRLHPHQPDVAIVGSALRPFGGLQKVMSQSAHGNWKRMTNRIAILRTFPFHRRSFADLPGTPFFMGKFCLAGEDLIHVSRTPAILPSPKSGTDRVMRRQEGQTRPFPENSTEWAMRCSHGEGRLPQRCEAETGRCKLLAP